MIKYVDTMGEYDAESTAWSDLAGGGGSSPYWPKLEGRLKGLRTIVGRDAATTLTNHGEIKLSCALWSVDTIVIFNGSGLQTAPALQPAGIDHVVDLPVKPGVPITLQGRDLTADTPVTNSVVLQGFFEAAEK